ncbi:MAG: N-acetyl-alpha-D-glucosaminyl L-malate synthase BshA [Acidobacteria bacterium RIFCSPLOWO2_02_FULL_67_36]|nr:MAG: N-acetyl-alpha-D-glucosaminyl L-malate synthase BshA [Acidobacteria bacterium RIFCSPLOWO2_02_FULL_67_36]OFW18630.1 MAG: N-acetyl-alpha-D-glucosaminyl L-malate synthase BshA [Acidobacteria bacterium RIFCSPLOWO2_12_FULL_66_21]
MNVGIVCYASLGGSGIVATELAKSLAGRGHDVHVLSTDPPFRLGDYQPGLTFHRVYTPAYPLFREPQYVLSLSNRIVQVAREFSLDVVHAHYAVPHATAAYLAQQILLSSAAEHVPQIITTLHGTDITLVGSDHSYAETVAFSIDRSDGVTAVSKSLREDTYRALKVRKEIEVIPNFLDCDVHKRVPSAALRARYCPAGCEKLVIHVSNFRPVKRVHAVVNVFARIAEKVQARLLLVGDGPDLGKALDVAKALGVSRHVEALGEQDQILPLLSVSDLFLLPSAQESFGLAALEAMACEVPVVASRVGGLSEVIDDGVTGFLHDPSNLQGMADSGLRLLTDPELHRRVAAEGRRTVRERFCCDLVVPRYEKFYEKLVAR